MSYIDIAKEKFENLKLKKQVKILAIESSCDETAIAIVEDGRKILSNVIATQIEIHQRFGGVVPEVASRNHITAISSVLNEALNEAHLTLNDIDAIAVTFGAGLVGALLVGVNFAKGLAYSLNLPLIAVSHIEGHVAANYLTHEKLTPPFICLMVSGGHTAIFEVSDYNKKTLLGTTIDDACGEAFDKVARVLGLEYPGGPNIEKLATSGQNNITFIKNKVMPGTLNFSFSGIKTSVINYLHTKQQKSEIVNKSDVARSFEEFVTDVLSEKAICACREKNLNKLVVAGGVGSNKRLHNKLDANKEGIEIFYPTLKLCTDNAAMIGSCAYYYVLDGLGLADLTLTAKPTVKLNVN